MGIGAMIGGSLISGVMGARSAGKAADAQVEAADKATELQREIYYNDIERMEPWYNSGTNALAAYNYELGLGPDPRTMQQVVTVNGGSGGQAGQGSAMMGGLDMGRLGLARSTPFSLGSTGITAQDVGGSFRLTGPNGTNFGLAADEEEARAIAARMAYSAGQQQGGPTSYMVGGQSYNTLEEAQAAAAGNADYRGFQETPGYQYALDQSQEAINRQAAARGMRYGGATLNALAADAQGRQNQEYGNWLNRVGGLAGQGAQMTGQMANMGQNFANQAGANMMAAGNARASGYMGQNAAFQGTMGNLFNIYGMQQAGMFGGGSMW